MWKWPSARYIYIVQEPGRAGNALVLSFVDDLDNGGQKIADGASSPRRAGHTTMA